MKESLLEQVRETFGYLVSYLVPGIPALAIAVRLVPGIQEMWTELRPVSGSIAILAVGSTTAGLIVYAYWALLFRLGCKVFRYQTLEPQDLTRVPAESGPVHMDAHQYAFRFYQFYGSMFVSLSAFHIMEVGSGRFALISPPSILILASAWICLPISVYSYNDYKVRTKALAVVQSFGQPSPEELNNVEDDSPGRDHPEDQGAAAAVRQVGLGLTQEGVSAVDGHQGHKGVM